MCETVSERERERERERQTERTCETERVCSEVFVFEGNRWNPKQRSRTEICEFH